LFRSTLRVFYFDFLHSPFGWWGVFSLSGHGLLSEVMDSGPEGRDGITASDRVYAGDRMECREIVRIEKDAMYGTSSVR
jgi:hypothetical protein